MTHIKDNLAAKLFRIQTFKKMKLEEIKDLISVADFKMCKSRMDKNPTWSIFTLDDFVKFLYNVIIPFFLLMFFFLIFCYSFISISFVSQRIINAADTATRLYREAAFESLIATLEMRDTMIRTQNRLIKSIWSQNFEKFISVKVKIKNRFPFALLLREKVLDDWLNKASFWTQIHLQVCFCPFALFLDISNCWSILNSWRRGLRLRSHHLTTSVPSILTGFL